MSSLSRASGGHSAGSFAIACMRELGEGGVWRGGEGRKRRGGKGRKGREGESRGGKGREGVK